MRSCAYCGNNGPLTREHVFADFIQARASRRILSESTRTRGRRFGGAPTIRDVCAACNNRQLSKLDQYAARLYDRYFHRSTASVCGELFRVSRGRLLRWLLKVSYNTARSDCSGEAHVEFAPYILGDRANPPYATDLVLGLVASQSNTTRVYLRSGDLFLPHIEIDLSLHRFVAINHFIFGILSWNPSMSRPSRRHFLRSFCEHNRLVLIPRNGFARLQASMISEDFWRSIETGEVRLVSQTDV